MRVRIRTVGNSKGVVLPKAFMVRAGLEEASHAEMTVERGAILLRKPTRRARIGWAEAAREVGARSGAELVLGEFGTDGDAELVW